ncbi:MAG: serine protease [Pseudomonadota bacterium]
MENSRVWQTKIGQTQTSVADGSVIELIVCRPLPRDPDQTGLTQEDDLSALRGLALQLVAMDGDWNHPWGNGILLAPGIGLTAKHVIDDFKTKLAVHELGGASIVAIGAAEGAAWLWAVHQVLSIDGTDLALLVLDHKTPWNNNLRLHLPEVHICLPKVGDRVQAFGFRAAEEKFARVEGRNELGIIGISVIGQVNATYPEGRDSSGLPGPCFEIEMPTVSGMSGGPVFDVSGRLIGIISRSFHWGADDGVTFASLVWTAAFRNINPIWPKGMYSGPTNLENISGASNRRCFLSYADNMRWEYGKLHCDSHS